MSQLKVDTITDSAGTGAPSFTYGAQIFPATGTGADGPQTIALTDPVAWKINSLTANRVYTLPGLGVKAGTIYYFHNVSNTFVVDIRASNNSQICVASDKYTTKVMALQNDPLTSAGWVVVDGTATENGKKQYQHNAGYYNGTPLVTATNATVTPPTYLVPYYASAPGIWRLKFNIVMSIAAVARTGLDIGISGVTLDTSSNYFQACAGFTTPVTASRSYAEYQLNKIRTDHPSASTSLYSVSGDVSLASKPTWAD